MNPFISFPLPIISPPQSLYRCLRRCHGHTHDRMSLALHVAAIACTDAPQVLVSCADWVEHALETDADPYLRTPEEELPFKERHNLDVYLVIAHFALPVFVKLCRKLKDIMDLMLYYFVLGVMRGGGALLRLLQRVDLRIHPRDLAHFRWLLSFL